MRIERPAKARVCWRWLTGVLVCAEVWWGGPLLRAQPAGGQDPGDAPGELVLTLEACVRRAVANHPEVEAARARVRAAQAARQQARLWPNPELELASEDGPLNRGSFAEESKQTVGVAQTIPFPGKKRLESAMARLELTRAEHQWRAVLLSVIREVKLARVRVLGRKAVLEATRESVKVAEALSAAVHERFRAGAVGEVDVLRAEALLEETRLELEEARIRWREALQELALLVGAPVRDKLDVVGRLREEPDPALVGRQPAEWLPHHPLVVAGRAEVKRAEVAVTRSSREAWPDVTLWVRGGRAGPADDVVAEVGLTLPLPVWDRGRYRMAEALARREESQAALAAGQRELLLTWEREKLRLEGAAAQARRLRREVLPRTEKAVDLLRAGYQAGKFDLLVLLDAERAAAEARRAHARALLEMNLAHVELEALMDAEMPELFWEDGSSETKPRPETVTPGQVEVER